MISLSPVIGLLSAPAADFVGPWLRKVGSAAQYAQTKADAIQLPCAWVVREAESVISQSGRRVELDVQFSVVVAVSNARGVSAADDDLLVFRRAIKSILLGNQYPANPQPDSSMSAGEFAYVGGDALEYTDFDLYWRDRYRVRISVTNYLNSPAMADDGVKVQYGSN